MSPSGVSYLDEIFSAIRDASHHLAEAETWLARADDLAGSAGVEALWAMSLLKAARDAHILCLSRLDALERQLSDLAPSGQLPVLLDKLPSRLAALRENLGASEERLHRLALANSSGVSGSRGRA